ncbi:MAG TPA: substrate-binding domain-containing protein [Steroidobacteraceae bacterium]|nr:substrate-binding domain-containing protein [Steroidobacteraceae bacterium]
MKNISIWVVVGALLVSVTAGIVVANGGVGSNAKHHKLLIGLSMDTLKEPRWQVDQKLFVERATQLGATVKVSSANGDDSVQIRDVNSMISDGVDVIVIIPHDGAAMSKAVQSAHAANIPVVAYDRLITNSDLDLYVTFDNVKVGEAQATYLVNALKGKGKIVRVYGSPTDNNSKLFKQGQDNVLKPYIDRGDIKVVHEDWADNWEPQRAKQIVNAAITNHGHDFQGVLASADGVAGGAIQALKEEGLMGKVLVTGQDAELAAVQRVVDGSQAMTIYKPIRKLATTAAELAVKMANKKALITKEGLDNGQSLVPSVFLPIITVDKANMVQTVIADGFQNFDDVYRNVPEAQRPARPNVSTTSGS